MNFLCVCVHRNLELTKDFYIIQYLKEFMWIILNPHGSLWGRCFYLQFAVEDTGSERSMGMSEVTGLISGSQDLSPGPPG